MPMVVGSLNPRDPPQFRWANTVLGNLKPTLVDAFHALKYSKYAEHYLAAIETDTTCGMPIRVKVDSTPAKL